MTRLLFEAGPFIWPLILLYAVIILLALFNLVTLLAVEGTDFDRRRRSIDAVLFWGVLAAALGFLGQWLGLHRMVKIVAEKGIVSPQAVTYGLSESLLTTIFGMFLLLLAALLWSALRLGLWNRRRRLK